MSKRTSKSPGMPPSDHPHRHGATLAASQMPKVISLSLLAVILFIGTSIGSVYYTFSSKLQQQSSDLSELLGTSRPTSTETVERQPTDSFEGQALNILILGSDDRAGANEEFGEDGGMRSDTAMIVHIAEDRSRVEVVSIPRDLIVEIPPCPLSDGIYSLHRPLGTNEYNGIRFNSAFSIGSEGHDIQHGAACAILTVEALTDIYIDDWAVVDMDGFRTMVDAIGGVHMCFDEAIDDRHAHLKIDAGCQTLDGDQALGVARVRKSLGDGSDIGRIGRQQELMGAMVDQVLSAGVLANPSKLLPFLNSASASLHTSNRLGNLNNLAGLAYSVRHIDRDDVNFVTPPLGYTGNVVVQTSDMSELWDKLREDLPLEVSDTEESGNGPEVDELEGADTE